MCIRERGWDVGCAECGRIPKKLEVWEHSRLCETCKLGCCNCTDIHRFLNAEHKCQFCESCQTSDHTSTISEEVAEAKSEIGG